MLKKLSIVLYLCLLADYVGSQMPVTQAVTDILSPSVCVKMTGYAGSMLDASYQNRFRLQDVDRPLAAFRNRTETNCRQSEFWGKWLTCLLRNWLTQSYDPGMIEV